LASKQAQKQENELQAIERAEARQNRGILTKFKNDYHVSKAEENNRHLDINRRKSERKKFEALDSLSTYNYHKAYKQIRKECVPGTSMWICENPVFHMWLSGKLKTLWLIGGCKCIMIPRVPASLK